MFGFFSWIKDATALVVGGMGFITLTFARDDFGVSVASAMKLEIVDFAAISFGILFLFGVYLTLKDVRDKAPARWNPWKRRAFKNLLPMIIEQFEMGRRLVGSVMVPADVDFHLQLGRLRAQLRHLEIEFPDADIDDQDEWRWWIGFLKKLLPLAAVGNLEAAQNLRRRLQDDDLHETQG